MVKRPLLIAVVAALVGLIGHAPAWSQQDATKRPKFGTSTAAVLVDVVVRDKKGKPVAGLTAADFQVFEDGTPQKIISCDAVGQGPPGGPPPGGPPPAGPPPGGPPPAGPPPAGPPPAGPRIGQTVVAL